MPEEGIELIKNMLNKVIKIGKTLKDWGNNAKNTEGLH